MAAPLVAQLAPAVDAVRLTLHVLAATVWVGGQITLAGLVPTLRGAGEGTTRAAARAFARLSWPAYVVLLATGIWNVSATAHGQGTTWDTVLYVKLAVVVLAGVAAWAHTRSRSRVALAVWGALAALASVGALALGVLLAG